MNRRRVGVLISGRGSNMQALVEAARDPAYPAEIALVISHNPDSGGLAWAREAQVPTRLIDHRPFGREREAHERKISAALYAAKVDVVALAGWMRLFTPWFVESWRGRLLNIHPSLLPLFPGLDTHRRALEAGVKLHGCTVHQVTEGVDEGPILGQAALPVLAGDDEHSLAERVLRLEHRLYPACLAAFVEGRPGPAQDAAIFNPAV
jgi:formyltetrahydrofolate-dependent phosphoribosylglycinamide formyltransferase